MSDRASQAPRELPVARVNEIPPGGCKIVEVEGRSIGVFNVHGSFVAVLNVCPHELAPVCLGAVRGTALVSLPGEYCWGREGEILACPWHGWEFDLITGRALADKRKRLRLYPVVVREDTVHLFL
jgi:3-phenylpropionate/trans-cinnamate dioxygenase ferredoxin subunit